MNRKHLSIALASALVTTVGITGCKKKEEPVVAPPAATTPAATTPAPTTPAPAAVILKSVDLGKAVDASNKVTAPIAVFAPSDHDIYAAVNTSGNPTGNKLNAKWTFQDGQTVHSESRDMAGADTIYAFKINNPNPWPVGKYIVAIDIDGANVQTREFEVK